MIRIGKNQYQAYQQIPHVCYSCGGTKTSKNKRGTSNWLLNINADRNLIGMLCSNCYYLLITYPKEKARGKFNKYYSYGAAQTWGFQVYAGWKQRTGYCSNCPNNIHDGSCKRTALHHKVYLRTLPWFGRVELCLSCHLKVEWDKGSFAERPNHHKQKRQALGIKETWSALNWVKKKQLASM